MKMKEIGPRAVADVRGASGTRAPVSKFFHFYAVFGKKLVSTPTLEVGAPSGKSRIRHCSGVRDAENRCWCNAILKPINLNV